MATDATELLPTPEHEFPCRSHKTMASFGRVPPRSPGYADAQVPNQPLPSTRYACIAHYWYDFEPNGIWDAGLHSVAFGFRQIEISITPRAGPTGFADVELYAVGDGFQSGRGCARGSSVPIEFRIGARVVASVTWQFSDVLDGHADPYSARWQVPIAPHTLADLDAVVLESASAWVRLDSPWGDRL